MDITTSEAFYHSFNSAYHSIRRVQEAHLSRQQSNHADAAALSTTMVDSDVGYPITAIADDDDVSAASSLPMAGAGDSSGASTAGPVVMTKYPLPLSEGGRPMSLSMLMSPRSATPKYLGPGSPAAALSLSSLYESVLLQSTPPAVTGTTSKYSPYMFRNLTGHKVWFSPSTTSSSGSSAFGKNVLRSSLQYVAEPGQGKATVKATVSSCARAMLVFVIVWRMRKRISENSVLSHVVCTAC